MAAPSSPRQKSTGLVSRRCPNNISRWPHCFGMAGDCLKPSGSRSYVPATAVGKCFFNVRPVAKRTHGDEVGPGAARVSPV
jgi:hypothetical protein